MNHVENKMSKLEDKVQKLNYLIKFWNSFKVWLKHARSLRHSENTNLMNYETRRIIKLRKYFQRGHV